MDTSLGIPWSRKKKLSTSIPSKPNKRKTRNKPPPARWRRVCLKTYQWLPVPEKSTAQAPVEWHALPRREDVEARGAWWRRLRVTGVAVHSASGSQAVLRWVIAACARRAECGNALAARSEHNRFPQFHISAHPYPNIVTRYNNDCCRIAHFQTVLDLRREPIAFTESLRRSSRRSTSDFIARRRPSCRRMLRLMPSKNRPT